ncbi:MAG TPA: YdeI/OmpD-associated family protein [Solirubrobacteraceae bacterium]|nr:YdeI/OmpD-associated family protein [Solirubrobacteraceae bacterium]
MFARLSSQNRYAVLYRIHEAKRSDTRTRRIERFVAMLARGETIHPQGKAN